MNENLETRPLAVVQPESQLPREGIARDFLRGSGRILERLVAKLEDWGSFAVHVACPKLDWIQSTFAGAPIGFAIQERFPSIHSPYDWPILITGGIIIVRGILDEKGRRYDNQPIRD